MAKLQARVTFAVSILSILSGQALAYCTCACVGGQVRNVCSNPQFDTEVICNRICPTNVAPTGAPQPLSGSAALPPSVGAWGSQGLSAPVVSR